MDSIEQTLMRALFYDYRQQYQKLFKTKSEALAYRAALKTAMSQFSTFIVLAAYDQHKKESPNFFPTIPRLAELAEKAQAKRKRDLKLNQQYKKQDQQRKARSEEQARQKGRKCATVNCVKAGLFTESEKDGEKRYCFRHFHQTRESKETSSQKETVGKS